MKIKGIYIKFQCFEASHLAYEFDEEKLQKCEKYKKFADWSIAYIGIDLVIH